MPMSVRGVLRALLRQNRECSLSMYLLLLELAHEEELSSLALERRLRLKGVRTLIHDAQCRRERWIACREAPDGKFWRLTREGRAVLARLNARMGGAHERS